MKRNSFFDAVGDTTHSAAEKGRDALYQAGDLLGDLGDYLAPKARDLGKEIGPRARDLADNVNAFVAPRAKDLRKKGASLAADARVAVQPALDDAWDRVHPYVDDARDRISPFVDSGRARIEKDLLPRFNSALKDIQSDPRSQEAAKRLAAAHRWVMPIKHPNLTSRFGPRWGRLHAGLDFGAPVGTSLFAMSSGVVTKAGNGGGYGNKIEITYWDGTVSYFAHMSEIDVKVGQQVRPGTYVGKSGNTGQSTGPHLHLEMHPKGGDPVDPMAWLQKHGVKIG